eukprot:CAMPEP_0113951850 /NCGR_PEP_ID=MMETSP1339-20121228/88207_1 /TAXON_ID=94617 /ORGANISM="Fibrocapsa japonica" /LENGTH=97 /DNA_ID=CAMNT_0000960241 /DNA_START=38 /DNA_END=332 /DNA_ORIENTATION=- /assembly_acc=CAM_ASM_000762
MSNCSPDKSKSWHWHLTIKGWDTWQPLQMEQTLDVPVVLQACTPPQEAAFGLDADPEVATGSCGWLGPKWLQGHHFAGQPALQHLAQMQLVPSAPVL